MTNDDRNISESLSGLAHLFEAVPKTEPVSFEEESRQRLSSAVVVDHRHLSSVIYEIEFLGKMSKDWKTAFEDAYQRIPVNKRIYARDAMVHLYCAFGDYESAAKFLAPNPYTTHEISTAIRVLLRLKRFHQAEAVVQLCWERLPAHIAFKDDDVLWKALDDYYTATNRWDRVD